MKSSVRVRLFCIILLLLNWTNALAQFNLGPNGLVNAPAPTLTDPGHIDLRRPGYVGKVGGVAFGATAAPAQQSAFTNFSLSYRPGEKDGKRLWVTVDGRQFPAPIYDWQLVPIAKFADSPSKSCVTLFGELNDRKEAERLLKNHDAVMNYHPALVNTLLGLRLFQLDILINDGVAVELPSQNGKYLLGEGETPPDLDANIRGWRALIELRRRLGAELNVETRSYVLTDEGRVISFSFDGGVLNITGEPYYYFWLFKGEFPGYDANAVSRRITEETTREAKSSTHAGRPGPAEEREAYVRMLLKQLGKGDGYYDIPNPPAYFTKLLSLKSDSARRKYVRGYTTAFLRKLVIYMRALEDDNTVVPLTEYSERVSAETKMLRSINPIIWDAGVNIMRYAAFFRYCKATYPSQWAAFLGQLPASVSPTVQTPTVMKRAR